MLNINKIQKWRASQNARPKRGFVYFWTLTFLRLSLFSKNVRKGGIGLYGKSRKEGTIFYGVREDMGLENNQKTFLALIRAGLWEKEIRLLQFGEINYAEVMRLADEQSMVGLVIAGLEQVKDTSVPKVELLNYIGSTLQVEERNKAMNNFISVVTKKMKEERISFVLVKGQGIAQCYERPLWRSSGDIDLFLDDDDYEKAKVFCASLASSQEPEEYVSKHIAYTIDSWVVELHGRMIFGLSDKADKVAEEVKRDVFKYGGIRVWDNSGTDVFLPNPDNDVIIIFNHFLGHFCFGGIGIRQLCDLCRLLWTYRDSIKRWGLKMRLVEMGLMSEWKVFASVAVDWLGMPSEAMPFYSASVVYKQRARQACKKMLKYGNLGHNIDESYRNSTSKWKVSIITFMRRIEEYLGLMMIFPIDSHRFFFNYLRSKREISLAKNNK